MKPISTFVVKPSLPKALQGLEALAYNLRWAWDPDTMDLFRRIDPILWETVYHNPVRMLNDISQERLNQLSENPGFRAHFKRVSESFRAWQNSVRYSNCLFLCGVWSHRKPADLFGWSGCVGRGSSQICEYTGVAIFCGGPAVSTRLFQSVSHK